MTGPGAVLRVATFNIRHGRGLDGRVDLRRTAEVLAWCNADLIALQELDRGADRSGGVDQADVLARLSGYHVGFHPTVERAGFGYGIALATREPVATRFHRLSRAAREEPRGLIETTFRGVSFLATHLSPSAEARRLQLADLTERVAGATGPVVLLGDLNATRRELTLLFEAGFTRPGWRPLTSPARFPFRQIDHILGGGGVAVTDRRALRTTASDHLPVRAVVRRS